MKWTQENFSTARAIVLAIAGILILIGYAVSHLKRA